MLQPWPLNLTSRLSKFFKNQEKMRLKIGKKLKTASLNSTFTGFKKEECTLSCSLLKNFEASSYLLTYKFTHQQPQKRFTSFKKIVEAKKFSCLTLIQKCD